MPQPSTSVPSANLPLQLLLKDIAKLSAAKSMYQQTAAQYHVAYLEALIPEMVEAVAAGKLDAFIAEKHKYFRDQLTVLEALDVRH